MIQYPMIQYPPASNVEYALVVTYLTVLTVGSGWEDPKIE